VASQKRPEKICSHCGEPFIQQSNTAGRFCNPQCWYAYRRARSAVNLCATCKQPIVTNDHAARRKFCSHLCFGASFIRARDTAEPPPVAGARWLPLTRGKFALVDDDLFDELAQRPWVYWKGYAAHSRSDGTPHQLHVFIVRPGPGIEVDHKNGDPLDNRRENLRSANDFEQARNTKKKRLARGATSRFKGVYYARQKRGSKRWIAMIRVDGIRRWLGGFESEDEAARAYDAAARSAYGEFASLNFPLDGERSAVG
jgi:endogenous inhibitor of DNA gyrase (YacG/DUF329 family)